MKAAVFVALLQFSAVVVSLPIDFHIIRGCQTSKLVCYRNNFVQSIKYTFKMGKGEGWGEGEGQWGSSGATEAPQWKNGLCGCFSSCRNCKL